MSAPCARGADVLSAPDRRGAKRSEPALSAYLVGEFRLRLHEMRGALYRTVVTTDEELCTLESHPSGSLIEGLPSKLVAAALSRLAVAERHEVDAAQARLRAIPIARACIDCQRRRE